MRQSYEFIFNYLVFPSSFLSFLKADYLFSAGGRLWKWRVAKT